MAHQLLVAWTHLTTSFTVQLFVLSTAVLLCGLFIHIWSQALEISFVDAIRIDKIEKSHPHLPSLPVIVNVFLCHLSLMVVGFHTIGSMQPFSGPYETIILAALFIIVATAGIVTEIKRIGARKYIFGFVSGTALAFIFLIFHSQLFATNPARATILFLLLIACVYGSWRAPYKSAQLPVQVTLVITFVAWLLLRFYGV